MSAQPYQPSALSDVTVSVDGDDTVVSFPRVLPYSVEKVWGGDHRPGDVGAMDAVHRRSEPEPYR